METQYTLEILAVLMVPVIIIFLLMLINQNRIKKMQELNDQIYDDEIDNQLIESEQNLFM